MSKGGGDERKVYDYLASVDYGISHGPLDSINEIIIKDKSAFVGPVTEASVSWVSKKKLFGGDDGEGGIRGNIEFYMGTWDQGMSPELAARHGDTPDNLPGYRGISHVFFRGEKSKVDDSVDEDILDDPRLALMLFFPPIAFSVIASIRSASHGFRWTSNNPYMPSVGFRVTRQPKGLTENTIYPITGIDENGDYIVAQEGDAFDDDGNFDPTKAPDANPAAIIYEILTNPDWGRGHLPAAVNIDSFNEAAATLKDENFGLSLALYGQDEIENYIKEILDHIKGALYQDPATGLWELKLIRGDYDADTLPTLDETNSEFLDIKTRGWGETVNQITVTYTDPVSEEDESVIAQNLANIAIQGGVLSDTRDYYGIRNPYLAKKVAERDVIEASATLTSFKAKVNREAFNLKPAGVVKVNWSDEGIENMPCRITNIDYGSAKDRTITIELIEDIFGEADAEGVVSISEPPPAPVAPTPTEPSEALTMTAPLPSIIRSGVSFEDLDQNYPQSAAMFFARDEIGGTVNYDVVSETVLPSGATIESAVTNFPPVRSVTLSSDIVAEAESVMPASLFNAMTLGETESGQLFLLGDSEANHELVMLDTYDDQTEEWTVARGIYDTVPRDWAAGTRMWRYFGTADQIDPSERFAGDTVTYKLLPVFPTTQLEPEDASGFPFTLTERPHAPFRPANVQIEGNGFGGPQYLSAPYPTTIEHTWANRDRTSEDVVASRWTDGNVTPETGQTTTIRFRDSIGGVLEFEATGLTGTSYNLDPNNLFQFRYYDVEFWAVRDGIESIMAASRPLEIRRIGYGHNYGLDFGTS